MQETHNNPGAGYALGIDIGSTTVKIAILDPDHRLVFSDYRRHFANIQETLAGLLKQSLEKLGDIRLHPMITGSGGLTLAGCLGVPFVQEVIRRPRRTWLSNWAGKTPKSSILKTAMWSSG